MFKPLALAAIALAVMAVSQGVARANPVTFGTVGSFNGGAPSQNPFVIYGPGAGSGTFTSTSLTGIITNNSSKGVVQFSLSTVTIGGVTYTLLSNPLALVPPSTSGGMTAIQAQITNPIPEPTSMFLLGVGLIGIASLARRRLLRRG